MREPAAGAPQELAEIGYIVGDWDVDYRAYRADTLFLSGTGAASITYMNRGHALMERMICPGCGASSGDIVTLSFLAFNSAVGVWNLGVADAYSESISVQSGTRSGDRLLLQNAVRHLGGAILLHYRTTLRPAGDGFAMFTETSSDYRVTWDTTVVRLYRPRTSTADYLIPRTDYGEASPDRPDEAAEFDFLVGTFEAPQTLTFPNGQVVNFPSTTTAVYALNGLGILEFGWYDVDPNLPDAATSIIRLYNRAMGRWESLYMANRGNGALFFGGRREDDRIVLGLFETDLSRGPISRFVFHNIRDDGYDWYSESSNDRGVTFDTTWVINATISTAGG